MGFKRVSMAPLGALLVAALALSACSHGRSVSVARSPAPETPGGENPGGETPGGENPGGPAQTPGTLAATADRATDLGGGLIAASGNVLLGLSDKTNLSLIGALGATTQALGENLADDGLAATPILGGALSGLVATGDSALGQTAALNVAGLPALHGPSGATPAVSVSALAPNADQLASVSIGGAQVLGQSGAAAIGVHVAPQAGGGLLGGATQGAGALTGVTQTIGGVLNQTQTSPIGGPVGGPVGGLVGGLLGGH